MDNVQLFANTCQTAMKTQDSTKKILFFKELPALFRQFSDTAGAVGKAIGHVIMEHDKGKLVHDSQSREAALTAFRQILTDEVIPQHLKENVANAAAAYVPNKDLKIKFMSGVSKERLLAAADFLTEYASVSQTNADLALKTLASYASPEVMKNNDQAVREACDKAALAIGTRYRDLASRIPEADDRLKALMGHLGINAEEPKVVGEHSGAVAASRSGGSLIHLVTSPKR